MNTKHYIYKIVNNQNDKVYIGQTANPDKRFSKALYHARKFKRAIEEIGWENFEVIIIDSTRSAKKADELELYYIKLYDAVENGYNSNYTAKGFTLTRTVDSNQKRRETISKLKWWHDPVTFESTRVKDNPPEGYVPGRGRKVKVKQHVAAVIDTII